MGTSTESNQHRCPPIVQTGGFTVDDFTVDHAAGTATCPNGLTHPISHTEWAKFGTACANCQLQARCTRNRQGKQLKGGAHDADNEPPAALPVTRTGWRDYRQHRPMIERTIAWLTRGNRRLRYRGITKNDHRLHHRAAALNLRRLVNLSLTHDGAA